MNSKKFSDYIIKTKDLCINLPRQKHIPIIVSDSKVDYLQKQSLRTDANKIEKSIVWLTKKGSKADEAVEWIIQNYEYLHDKYGDFTLYLWTGSCDAILKKSFKNSRARYARNKYWLSLCSKYANLVNRSLTVFNRLQKFAKLKKFEFDYSGKSCILYSSMNRTKVAYSH